MTSLSSSKSILILNSVLSFCFLKNGNGNLTDMPSRSVTRLKLERFVPSVAKTISARYSKEPSKYSLIDKSVIVLTISVSARPSETNLKLSISLRAFIEIFSSKSFP